jgi:molybdopterin synthase sulfur carrier subunit
MKITVRYFASLRDQRGVSQETLTTQATEPSLLYNELSHEYGFTLSSSQVRYVVNGAYVEPTEKLCEGYEVVFIPPVAGG